MFSSTFFIHNTTDCDYLFLVSNFFFQVLVISQEKTHHGNVLSTSLHPHNSSDLHKKEIVLCTELQHRQDLKFPSHLSFVWVSFTAHLTLLRIKKLNYRQLREQMNIKFLQVVNVQGKIHHWMHRKTKKMCSFLKHLMLASSGTGTSYMCFKKQTSLTILTNEFNMENCFALCSEKENSLFVPFVVIVLR